MNVPRAIEIAVLAAAVALFSAGASAACSASKVYALYKKGIEVEDIAETCEMDEDDVQAIIKRKKREERQKSTTNNGGGDQVFTPPRQAFCCDTLGNSRCAIVAGSTQIGSGCFCPGQGYGVICR
jgi:hypothetical protein